MNDNMIQKPEGTDLWDRLGELLNKTDDKYEKETLAFAMKHIDDLRQCIAEMAQIVAPFLYANKTEVENILIDKTYAMTILKPAIDKTAMDWSLIEADFKKRYSAPGVPDQKTVN